MGERSLLLVFAVIFCCMPAGLLAMQCDDLHATVTDKRIADDSLDQEISVRVSTPSWRRTCTSTWRALCGMTCTVAKRCWQWRMPLAAIAILWFAAHALPGVGGACTDTAIAYDDPMLQPDDLDLQVDFCAELAGTVSDLLRLNLRRCWPIEATYVNAASSEQLRTCLADDFDVITVPPECASVLYDLAKEYAVAVDDCLARCMSPSFSCLTREYSPDVEPFLYCAGPGCLDTCVGETLPWSTSRYTWQILFDE